MINLSVFTVNLKDLIRLNDMELFRLNRLIMKLKLIVRTLTITLTKRENSSNII